MKRLRKSLPNLKGMMMASKSAKVAVALGIALAPPAEGYYGYVHKDLIGILTYCYGETQNAKDM